MNTLVILKLAIIMQKEFGTWNFLKCLKKEFVPQNRSKFQKGIAFQFKFLKKEFVPGIRSFWNEFLPSPANNKLAIYNVL